MLTRTEFEAAFKALRADYAARQDNVSCIGCEHCSRCTESMFCIESQGLVRCQYCTRSIDCTDCAHCQRSTACLRCTHCDDCERCTASAYLVKSIGCNECTYCYGCVGLSKKDFHILNQPYDRQTYFAIVAALG